MAILMAAFAFAGCNCPIGEHKGLQSDLDRAIGGSRSGIVAIARDATASPGSPTVATGVCGLGVILDESGWIVTTERAVRGHSSVTIYYQDGCSHSGKVAGVDPESGVAFISTGDHACGCFPIPAKEEKPVRLGQIGIALANTPVTRGVSAALGVLSESWLGGDDYYTSQLALFQTGDIIMETGGAGVSLDGGLLGICEDRVEGHSGAWTLIPAATIQRVSSEIRNKGSISRGWLGIYADDFSQEPAGGGGGKTTVRVLEVVSGSPASIAQIESGMLLLSVNGEPISGVTQLRRLVTSLRPGEMLAIDSQSPDGALSKREIRLGSLPTDPERLRLCRSRSL